MQFLIRMGICTHIYLSHITPSLAQVATDPSLLNPCCFQGSCLTLHRASFHLPMHSILVFTEGNQSEIQQSRLISIVKGCGEYAITQPGCLAALHATGEENQREKFMHQRDSSRALWLVYTECAWKKSEGIHIWMVALRSGHSSHHYHPEQGTHTRRLKLLKTARLVVPWPYCWPHGPENIADVWSSVTMQG